MKKIWLALKVFPLLLLIFTLSCKNASEPVTTSPPPQNNEQKQEEEKTAEQKLLEKASKALTIQTVIEADSDKIILPSKLKENEFKDIKISWVSQNKDILTDSGIVTHKDSSESDTVRITAILKLNKDAITKAFNITVKNKPFSDDLKTLNTQASSLNILSSIESTITVIDLPSSLSNNTIKITWKSSNENVINTTTKVVKHSDKKESDTVLLTATLTLNKESVIKEFSVEVKNALSDKKMVELATASLEIEKEISETEQRITLPLYLNDYPGVTITWTSSDTSVIDPTANYPVRHKDGAPNDSVTLTATVKKGEEQREKAFSVTVKNYEKTVTERETEAERIVVDNIKKEITVPSQVTEYTNSIPLPLKVYDKQYEKITITWESSDISVISNDGKVTHTMGRPFDTITLTATFKGFYITDTKAYTVKVLHPTAAADESRVLEIAKNNIQCPLYTDYTALYETINLPSTYNVDDKIVNLSWSASSDIQGSFECKENNLLVRRDVQDIKLKLTASLSYNNKGDSKVFDFIIPGYKKFDSSFGSTIDYWEFKDNNILEYYYNSEGPGTTGKRYTINNLNLNDNTLTLTKCEEYKENKWVNLEDEYQKKVPLFNDLEVKMTAAEASPSIQTLYDAMTAYCKIQGEAITEDELYSFLIQSQCFDGITEDTPDNVLIAKSLDEKTKQEAVKKILPNIKQLVIMNAQVPEDTTSWSVIVTAMKNNLKEPSLSYEYSVQDNPYISITFSALYDSSKPWYEQNGFYQAENDQAKFHIYSRNNFGFNYKIGDTTRSCSITLSSDKNSFDATYNENGTEKVDGTWNVISNSNNETITVSKPGFNFTLKFVPETIH